MKLPLTGVYGLTGWLRERRVTVAAVTVRVAALLMVLLTELVTMTPITTSADSGSQFTVIVTNSVSSTISNAATLTVTAATVAPAILTQPASQTVNPSQTATFMVAASGTAPLTYQWRKNGVAINGATSSSYTTPATTASDNGSQFTAVIINSIANITSNAATLTVKSAGQLTASTMNLNYGNMFRWKQ